MSDILVRGNALERAIAVISPAWGLSRTARRVQLNALRSYAAAGMGRRTKGFGGDDRSIRAETGASNATMRRRARKLVQDNPYAAAALDKLVGFQVGTGIVPRSATGDAALDRKANAVWAEWAANADWHRRHDVYGLQAMAARCRVESGEALVQWMPLTAAKARARGMRIPLAVTVKEPDYLDEDRIGTRGLNAVDQGIEFDDDDLPVAYWMYDRHPGDVNVLGRYGLDARRIDARQVMHLFRAIRPGQIRGVTEFAAVMLRARMLDDLEDAALEAARVQASLAAFVTSDADPAKGPLTGRRSAETGEKTLQFRPGMIERLNPGENVTLNSPTGNSAVEAEAKRQLRAIAEGMGLTYDILTGDLSGANYSSLRAGRLVVKRRTEEIQWNTLIPQMCAPMWGTVMQMAVTLGMLPDLGRAWPARWSPPRFEMLDPAAEIKAMKEAVRGGFSTMPQALGELGIDPDDQVADYADWNAKIDAAGLTLDTDPRKIAGASGTAQTEPTVPATI